MKIFRLLFICCMFFYLQGVNAAPFDKTGLIDLKSSATIAGSCFGATYAGQLTALSAGNFELSDRLESLNKTFDRLMSRGDGSYYQEASQAWQDSMRKAPNQQQCNNCIAASAYCASLLKR